MRTFFAATLLVLCLSIGAIPYLANGQTFNGGGLGAGVGVAGAIVGPVKLTPAAFVESAMTKVLGFLSLAAFVTIVVAGFYLILGFGNDQSKETAKKIIIYTATGLVIVLLASELVSFVFFMVGKGGTSIAPTVTDILNRALSFIALAALVTIVVAGIYLVLGFGSEQAKEKAKKIIIYTVVGLMIVLLAQVIVDATFFFGNGTGESPRGTIVGLLNKALSFLSLAAVVAIVIAGIFLIFSGGNEAAKDRAKKIVIYTIIGLVIILFARIIVGFFSKQLPGVI